MIILKRYTLFHIAVVINVDIFSSVAGKKQLAQENRTFIQKPRLKALEVMVK